MNGPVWFRIIYSISPNRCMIVSCNTPNEKCFLYNSKDGVYASKKYRIEDMTMKYPHTYKTIINNPHACDDGVYVVVGSPVGPRQFTERVATREAWGAFGTSMVTR